MSHQVTPGIGHNRGPSAERGAGFRAACWRVARAELLPTLPVEVVRMQVRRAKALGLPYRTYAGVRATTGRDLVAFLFSSNALGLFRDAEAPAPKRCAALGRIAAERHLGTAPGLSPAAIAAALTEGCGAAIASARALPAFGASWGAMRADMAGWLGAQRLAGGAVLMIGETDHEAEMAAAGRLAGFLSGERYFAEAPGHV